MFTLLCCYFCFTFTIICDVNVKECYVLQVGVKMIAESVQEGGETKKNICNIQKSGFLVVVEDETLKMCS